MPPDISDRTRVSVDKLLYSRVVPSIMPGVCSDPNFFETTVEPLLAAGREGDLCEWLKKNGLIAKEQKCPNNECLTTEKMQWHRARVVDKFNWVCLECKKKVPARHGSFFADFKCELGYALRVIDSWCKNMPLSDVSGEGRTKVNVAKRIYNGCAQVAEWQLKKIVGDFKLGGTDVVVIVDVFPDGNMSLEVPTTSHNNNFSKRVLCIADTAHVPVRVWASLLDGSNKENSKIVEMVKNHVMLGSTIVTNEMLYPLLHNLPGIGEVISTEALMNLDINHDHKSLKNLETIWATTVEACIQLQDMSTTHAEQHLYELQWRQMYGFIALPSMIQQIVEYTAYNNPICPPLPSIWPTN
ncbi:uncharacterized protein LOC114123445 [Aphis gossypii]|uniref:Uncharacterized protein n=2 Tax=Aphis TaxID=464929 RepID=A0A9P0NTW2_APHGO|nr:uncharacterized protein LOC114123445 [Aphis gossypii]CAH1738251.1 unnamed protein product [Aphis gossypii]